MSADIEFVCVKATKKSYFSNDELDEIKNAKLEFNKKNSYLLKEDKFKIDVATISCDLWNSWKNKTDTHFEFYWFNHLKSDSLIDKIDKLVEYHDDTIYIDMKTGQILNKMLASRCFCGTLAREINEYIFNNALCTNIENPYSYTILDNADVKQFTNIISYIRYGLQYNIWDLDKEYNMCISEFVKFIGTTIYGYDEFSKRKFYNSEFSIYQPEPVSVEKIVKDEDGDIYDEDGCNIDSDDTMMYLDFINSMDSFFKEAGRLHMESVSNACCGFNTSDEDTVTDNIRILISFSY